MPLYNFLKNLFGFPENRPTNNSEGNDRSYRNDYRDQFLNPNNEYYEDSTIPQYDRDSDERDSGNIKQFNIFTDPLEMHRYFEEQLNEVIKSFGTFGMFDKNDGTSFFGFNDMPALGSPELPQEPSTSNLRDHLLKPGYHSTKEGTSVADTDLDGKVNLNDLDSLLKSRSPNNRSNFQSDGQLQIIPKVRTFGQSITSKTIRMPDGTVETHRSVRDNSGNEETTVTRQLGDKQYTVTIKTDKNGRQEKIEDMKNIDEKDLPRFTKNWQHSTPQSDINMNIWFENLFK